ncbi:MAG: hypothetical protein NXI01_05255 [Gammaproteobacteria bacterium]|nr:hypothetical protein [Gammaproteobacteria bacterium]
MDAATDQATESTALLQPATTPQDPKIATLGLLYQFLEDAKPSSLFSRHFWVSKPKKIEFQAIKDALAQHQYKSIDDLFDISNNPDVDEKTKYVKQLIQTLGIKYSFHHSDSKMRIMDALIQIVHMRYSQAGFLEADLVAVLQQLITVQIAEHQKKAARVRRYIEVKLPHDLDGLKTSLARALEDMETSITDIGKVVDPSTRGSQTFPPEYLELFENSLAEIDDDASGTADWRSLDGSDLEHQGVSVSEFKYVVCTPMTLCVIGFIGLAIVANVAMPIVPVVVVTLAAVSLMAYGGYLMVKRCSVNRADKMGSQAEMNLFAPRNNTLGYSALSQVDPSTVNAGC